MTKFWVKSRKLAVIKEHQDGATFADIEQRHGIPEEELREWMDIVEKRGKDGLRVTHSTQYRKREKRISTHC